MRISETLFIQNNILRMVQTLKESLVLLDLNSLDYFKFKYVMYTQVY